MTGVIAQLRQLHRRATARAVVLLVALGLLAAGGVVPHAAAGIDRATGAPPAADCPMTGGAGHAHDPADDARSGHRAGGADMAGAGDGCGPAACCPADLAVGVETTPPAGAPAPRIFGLDAPPPGAPDDRRERPPRIS